MRKATAALMFVGLFLWYYSVLILSNMAPAGNGRGGKK